MHTVICTVHSMHPWIGLLYRFTLFNVFTYARVRRTAKEPKTILFTMKCSILVTRPRHDYITSLDYINNTLWVSSIQMCMNQSVSSHFRNEVSATNVRTHIIPRSPLRIQNPSFCHTRRQGSKPSPARGQHCPCVVSKTEEWSSARAALPCRHQQERAESSCNPLPSSPP